ncbi:MAG: hypothetical protein AB1635_11015 [Acidobacteriota bacterium]
MPVARHPLAAVALALALSALTSAIAVPVATGDWDWTRWLAVTGAAFPALFVAVRRGSVDRCLARFSAR